MKKTGAILILILHTFLLNAQDTDGITKEQRKLGIGVFINQFKILENNDSEDLISFPKLQLSYFTSEKFRVGSMIGMQYENKDGGKSFGYLVGFNFHGVLNKGKVNLFYGLTFDFQSLSGDYSNGLPYYSSYIDKTNSISVGPEIGTEYFLSPHLSIGAKVGLISYREKSLFEVESIYFESEENNTLFSLRLDTGVSIKFWF